MTKIDRYSAAGGIVRDGCGHVLVLYRPGRDEIRLPKGHVNPNEAPEAAALREVEEESGYGGLEIRDDLGTRTIEYDNPEKSHVVREERYFLTQPADGQPPRSGPHEDQYEPAWVDLEVAERILTYAEEREWIRRARRKLAEGCD